MIVLVVSTSAFSKTLVLIAAALLWLYITDVLNNIPAILEKASSLLLAIVEKAIPFLLAKILAFAIAVAALLVSESNSTRLLIVGMFLVIVGVTTCPCSLKHN